MKNHLTGSAALLLFFSLIPLTLKADIPLPPPLPQPAGKTAMAEAAEAAATTDGGQYDILRFAGRDTISGKLISLLPDKCLLWSHPDAEKPIEFKYANLREISLSGKHPNPPAGTANIRLTNGDIIKGSIVKLDSQNLIVKTWYAGELKLARKMLKEIIPSTVSTGIYEGPNDIKEWTLENQRDGRKAEVVNKTLVIPGNTSAGRDMKLPDMAKIEFDMSFAPNSNVNIFLYSEQLARHQGNSYIINISSNYIYVQRFSRNEGSNNIGQGESRKLTEKRQTHFVILVNKKQRSFTIIVNGAMMQQMIDSHGEFCGKGTMMSFFNGNSLAPLKIRNLVVSKWDGRLPNATADAEESKTDNILFSNDDKVTGKLKSINDGQITFDTEFASLTIPLERVKNISVSGEGAQVAKRNANDIRLFFNNDERLTANLAKIADGKVTAKSENFGSGDFLLNAFRKIALNIYAEPVEGDKTSDTNGDDDSSDSD
ncbi:MAG: hypothetical protein WC637_00915 [Victivallales bacterium]